MTPRIPSSSASREYGLSFASIQRYACICWGWWCLGVGRSDLKSPSSFSAICSGVNSHLSFFFSSFSSELKRLLRLNRDMVNLFYMNPARKNMKNIKQVYFASLDLEIVLIFGNDLNSPCHTEDFVSIDTLPRSSVGMTY